MIATANISSILRAIGLALALFLGACANEPYSAGSYPAEKPIFSADASIATLRPTAIFPDLGNVPAPALKIASSVVIDKTDGTVYAKRTTSIVERRNGYALARTRQRASVQCNPVTLSNVITVVGLIDIIQSLEKSSPSCPNIGVARLRVEGVELQEIAGSLFPLRVGNVFSFKIRELVRDRDDVLDEFFASSRGSNVMMSNFEHWLEYELTVAERLSSYQLHGGEDIGEVFVIHRTIVDGPETHRSELYFSTKLNWPVLFLQPNDLAIQLLRWE